MPRQPRFPAYPSKKHASGQARITVQGKAIYLGLHGSPESWAEYERLLAEWRASQSEPDIAAKDTPVRTVQDLTIRWMAHAGTHYLKPDGKPKTELHAFREALRPLVALYGHIAPRDFGPKALRTLQHVMATGDWPRPPHAPGRKEGWCRRVVNRMTVRIRTMFKWAASEELIPVEIYQALTTVGGLRQGQHGVRESDPVTPVPEEDLAKTISQLGTVLRAIVDLLVLTGARVSEILSLCPHDINRSGRVELVRGITVELGSVWAAQPAAHKTAHRGHDRVILLGPRAQEVLKPFLLNRPDDTPLFSPAESVQLFRQAQRERRQTPVQPSQIDRSKKHPQRRPGSCYTPSSLDQAIARACKRAGVPAWSAGQLRHSAATRLVAEFGWDLTRILLGHRSVDTTRIYALDDLKKAAQAMEKAG